MSYSLFPSPTEDALVDSPSAAGSASFIDDQLIRERGYAIKSRPEGSEPVWTRNGVDFTHEDVLRREKLNR